MILILGIVCLLYYVFICLTLKRWNSTFSRFWLAAGILLFVISRIHTNDRGQAVVHMGILVLTLIFLVTEGIILVGMLPRTREEYACLIVPGAQVRGRKITDSLWRRLNKAVEYLKEHPDTYVIVSGGRGKGEDITEAEAMEAYLLANGIRKKRIRKEDQSRTTEENLKFSLRYIADSSKAVGIVSNNFHVYRACCYAKRVGIQKPYPLAAGCHPVLFVNYLVRECFAVWKMYLHCSLYTVFDRSEK